MIVVLVVILSRSRGSEDSNIEVDEVEGLKRPVPGSCEEDNKLSGSVKCKEFLD
jgi:hypothetical protein